MDALTMTTRADAPAQATQEYAALLASLRALPSSAWSAPTDCGEWTVRDMVAHVNGAAEEAARPHVMVRHYARAVTLGRARVLVDAVNEQQVAERLGRTPAQLMDELERLSPKAVRGRQRTPSLIRRVPLPRSAGVQSGDTMGYLNDVTYTRDIWMHRIDIARATGTAMPESGAEPAIVDQILRDLGRAWTGPAFTLTLTGRTPVTRRIGAGTPREAPALSVDAVALCRLLAGRSDETGLSNGTPEAELLLETRLLF